MVFDGIKKLKSQHLILPIFSDLRRIFGHFLSRSDLTANKEYAFSIDFIFDTVVFLMKKTV